jgi:hypothetical protein
MVQVTGDLAFNGSVRVRVSVKASSWLGSNTTGSSSPPPRPQAPMNSNTETANDVTANTDEGDRLMPGAR